MKDCGFKFDHSYLDLPDVFYTQLDPMPVPAPEIVILNETLATQMGLEVSKLSPTEQAALFSGNRLPPDAKPFAQAYAGHQFGHFTMLGDGRAHMWGEHIIPDNKRLDIQFKGSGRTPYSRQGDGRAALGPMLREYLMSEAMHALRIPTTRSLAVVTTGENIRREAFLAGAILTRVATSHIRVGTFEFAALDDEPELVESLMDYAIERHDPEVRDAPNRALAFLNKVMERQADLIVHWMRVGFIHGVMNTDNMTISGETIDYGPCAFMDAYDPKTVFSSIDHMGRYAYTNQPLIAQWNLARLAEALLPMIDVDMSKAIPLAEKAINGFTALYHAKWLAMMRTKLGLFDVQKGDEQLISDLLDWMQTNRADYTNTFRDLSQSDRPSGQHYKNKAFLAWYERWQARLKQNAQPFEASLALMKDHNPAVIPRNHKVEEALDAATNGDLQPFHDLLSALKDAYSDHADLISYQSPPAADERVYQTFCGT